MTYYVVQFFPPGSQGIPGDGAASMEPVLIQIGVTDKPPYITVADDADWIAEPGTVAIGNTQRTVYHRIYSGPLGVDLMAETRSGALAFTFHLHVSSSSSSVDLDLKAVYAEAAQYLGMLQGFQLT